MTSSSPSTSTPAEVDAFDCLTSPEELVFLLREIERHGLPVTHLAPNYGAEKGWDYRGTDGLEALEHRVATLQAIAGEFGVMLDFHSADDLTAPVRAVLHRATGGWLHYKISPMVQLLYAEVLQDHYPELFLRWWEDSLDYARREAEAGSRFRRRLPSRLRDQRRPGAVPAPPGFPSLWFRVRRPAHAGRPDAEPRAVLHTV